MSFYDLSKEERANLVEQIKTDIAFEIKKGQLKVSTTLNPDISLIVACRIEMYL